MFVTNWISTTKIQKISEITNFFRHYFLSRTEVTMVQIKIKDNNRNREVAFIKTVPHTEKVFTDDDPKGHIQTVYYWEADPEDFFECKLPIDAFGKQNINPKIRKQSQ